MPVVRKPIQINDTRSIQPVRMPDNRMGEVLSNVAGGIIETSRQMGRFLAEEAELKGKAMVREAIFNKDPKTGAPQIPENRAAEMGRIARQTYDAGITDRMIDEIGTASRMRIDEARIEYENDLEGFEKAVVTSLGELEDGLPPEFKGAFQTIAQKELADASFNVGRAQMLLDKDIRRSSYPSYIKSATNNLIGLITSEQPDLARANMIGYMTRIMNEQEDILARDQKQKHIQTLLDATAHARIFADAKLNPRTASSVDLINLRNALELPRSQKEAEALANFFPDYNVIMGHPDIDDGFQENWTAIFPMNEGVATIPGDFALGKTYNKAAGDRFAALLGTYISQANARETQVQTDIENRGLLEQVINGDIPLDKKIAPLYNTWLGAEIGLPIVNGKQMPITAEMIKTGMVPNAEGKLIPIKEEQRHEIVEISKRNGNVPTAIKEALRSWEHSLDHDQAFNLFTLYKDYKEQGNSGLTGNVRDVTVDAFGEEGHAFMQMLEIMHDQGSSFDYALEQATGYVQRISEIDKEGNGDAIYGQMLDKFIMKEADQTWRNFWNPNQAGTLIGIEGNEIDNAVAAWLSQPKGLLEHIFPDKAFHQDGEVVDPSEMQQAAIYFKSAFLLQAQSKHGNPVEEALQMTRNAFAGRFESSKYTTRRTMHAPDMYMKDPREATTWKALGKWAMRNIKKPVVEAVEDMATADLFMTHEEAEIYRKDYGSRKMGFTILDGVIDHKIKEILKSGTFSAKYDDFEDNELYVAGVHYMMEYVPSSGDNPAYRILMRDEAGLWNVINPEEPYQPLADHTAAVERFTSEQFKDLANDINDGSIFDSDFNFFKLMGGGMAVPVSGATDQDGAADSDSTMLESADADFTAGATKTVNAVGEGAEAVVDAAADGLEGANSLATKYVGKDKTGANRASSSDQSETQVSEERANTVLTNTLEGNNGKKLKISTLWKKNHAQGKYLRNAMISNLSEDQRQRPRGHRIFLMKAMQKAGWMISPQEAQKMLETYKLENPEWFK